MVAAVSAAEARSHSPGRPPRPPQPSLQIPSPTKPSMPPIYSAVTTPSRGGSEGGGVPAGLGGAPFRRSFNTARPPRQLDTLRSASPLSSALQAQYAPVSAGGGGGEAVAAQSRLHERVSALAERYCEKLMVGLL